MNLAHTPMEIHEVLGRPVYVKREDLCCPFPGPSFSKMRGAFAHIQSRPEKVIGVLDTFHSKAGWAVSYACQELGKQAVVYWPQYLADKRNPQFKYRESQENAQNLGAHLVGLDAGRSAILYHGAKRHLAAAYGAGAYMMPNALKLEESVTENATEAVNTAPALPPYGMMLISVSSGTVAAGVVSGLRQAGLLKTYEVVLHMGYSRAAGTLERYVALRAGVLSALSVYPFTIIDEGYSYKQEATNIEAPFPCNPHYDLKAWKWLTKYINAHPEDKRPLVFWNIGA